jgi:hypothetical protein
MDTYDCLRFSVNTNRIMGEQQNQIDFLFDFQVFERPIGLSVFSDRGLRTLPLITPTHPALRAAVQFVSRASFVLASRPAAGVSSLLTEC